MAVVILSFEASEEQIIEGIPEFVTIESNIPSTIYYTIDGSTPTTDSPIYTGIVLMPDGETSVILSAFGVDSDEISGAILTQTFAADFSRLDRKYYVNSEGLLIDSFDDSTNISIGFDADGSAAAFSDIDDINLRLLRSDKGRLGIAEGTVINIETPLPQNTPFPYDDNFQISSSLSDTFFNPLAKTITIDNRIESDLKILNRPFGSMRQLERDYWGWNELGSTDSTYISGGFVRRFYSGNTNTMGSYYFDHNTGRWVIGLQALPSPGVISYSFNQSGQPLVFQWIYGGRHSIIPI